MKAPILSLISLLPIILILGVAAPMLCAQEDFIRGDCVNDGRVDAADGLWIVYSTIYAGALPPCRPPTMRGFGKPSTKTRPVHVYTIKMSRNKGQSPLESTETDKVGLIGSRSEILVAKSLALYVNETKWLH